MNKFESAPAESDEQKESAISALAGQLHDEWRAPRIKEDGSYEPRIKKTEDQEWIAEHGTDEVDIANTAFPELPADWRAENQAAAETVMDLVFQAAKNGRPLDDAFIEEASAQVHDKWLERNGEWAPEELKKPFAELPEKEKEKDRVQVRKAIETFEAAKNK